MRYLLIFILLMPMIGFAQVVNIESDRGGDKQGLHGSSELGLSLQKGNVKVFQYQAGLRLDYISGIHHNLLIGSVSYGEEEGKPFNNTVYSHLRWTAMWLNHVGTEIFTQNQKDEFRLLQIRQLTGFGIRFTAFEDHLAIGLGGMSDYEQIEGLKDGNLDARGTSYIRLGKQWKDGVKGQLIAYYQPLFTNPSDYRVLGTGSLEFKVDKVFSVLNEFNYSYDTRPPEEVVKEDLQLRVKFKVKW
tara:strand:- start:255 stop:986 length:732 start_codon:yes stop_codon:yes gene_type:complete